MLILLKLSWLDIILAIKLVFDKHIKRYIFDVLAIVDIN